MLTPEQQRFWSYFKWDPQTFTHGTAAQVLEAPKSQRSRIINAAFTRLMQSETDPEIRARVIKTWLSRYQLPMDPSEIDLFDQFHSQTGPLLRSTTWAQNLETY